LPREAEENVPRQLRIAFNSWEVLVNTKDSYRLFLSKLVWFRMFWMFGVGYWNT